MQSSKKISKIVLVLSLVAVFSFLTILSVNGVNFQSDQYQVDNDSSSIIQGKDDGGGGVIDLILQGKDDGGGGVIDLILQGKDDGGGGVIDLIIQGKDDGGGGVIDLIIQGKDDGGGGVIDQITF